MRLQLLDHGSGHIGIVSSKVLHCFIRNHRKVNGVKIRKVKVWSLAVTGPFWTATSPCRSLETGEMNTGRNWYIMTTPCFSPSKFSINNYRFYAWLHLGPSEREAAGTANPKIWISLFYRSVRFLMLQQKTILITSCLETEADAWYQFVFTVTTSTTELPQERKRSRWLAGLIQKLSVHIPVCQSSRIGADLGAFIQLLTNWATGEIHPPLKHTPRLHPHASPLINTPRPSHMPRPHSHGTPLTHMPRP